MIATFMVNRRQSSVLGSINMEAYCECILHTDFHFECVPLLGLNQTNSALEKRFVIISSRSYCIAFYVSKLLFLGYCLQRSLCDGIRGHLKILLFKSQRIIIRLLQSLERYVLEIMEILESSLVKRGLFFILFVGSLNVPLLRTGRNLCVTFARKRRLFDT